MNGERIKGIYNIKPVYRISHYLHFKHKEVFQLTAEKLLKNYE